jgi:hypothetical protein
MKLIKILFSCLCDLYAYALKNIKLIAYISLIIFFYLLAIANIIINYGNEYCVITMYAICIVFAYTTMLNDKHMFNNYIQ